jgi:hypothetical protein
MFVIKQPLSLQGSDIYRLLGKHTKVCAFKLLLARETS